MTLQPGHTVRRFLGPAVIVVLVALIVLFVAVGVRAAAAPPSRTAGPAGPVRSSSAPVASDDPTADGSATTSASGKATRAAKLVPASSSAPTPQPTKTAEITKPAPIAKELTAKVSKLEAVQGKADGPGEIAGPAVRFTITITNATGKAADLSNAVVNAYYGSAATPAIPLQSPGGTPFPKSAAAGSTASGVFLFNIPSGARGNVEVTVDTSVKTPVLAFQGSVPR